MQNVEKELSPLQNIVINLSYAVTNTRELGNRLRIINNSLTGEEFNKEVTGVADPEAEIMGSIDELTRSLTHLNYNLGEITKQILKLEQTI